MAGQLGELVISLQADIARFSSDMGKANKLAQESMQKMSTDITGSINQIQGQLSGFASTIGKSVAGVTALLGGGAMFRDMVNTTKEVTGEVVKLTKVFGVTAEQASVMRVALDDAFLTVDDAVGASDRLTRAAIKNGEAFKTAGIDIHKSDGSLKDSLSIMMEVNDYLKTLQEGKERDSAAMALYGKGWREFSGILRLTSEGMQEAQKRAEDLHLIFGDDKVQAVKKYRLAMKDIGDVSESLKVQIGQAFIPELTKLAVSFGDSAVKAIPAFISGIHSVEAEVTRMAMLADKAGGSITTFMHYLAGGNFTESGRWWAEQNKMYEQRYKENEKRLQTLANLEVGLDENGNPIKTKAAPKAGGKSPFGADTVDTAAEDNYQKQVKAAHDAYLTYLKAFAEEQAAIIKAANALAEEANKQAYEWGLTDLKTYLDTKHRLTEESAKAELDAKKKELADARAAEKLALAAYDKDNTGDTAKNVNESRAKVAEAAKAVIEAQNKLNLAIKTGDDETKKANFDQIRGYQEIKAALLDLQGDELGAAAIRRRLDDESLETQKLIAEAMKGNQAAADAYWAKEEANTYKDLELKLKIAKQHDDYRLGTQSIVNNTPDLWGNINYGKQAKDEYDAKQKALDDEIALEVAKQTVSLEKYNDYLARKKALEDQYNAQQRAATVQQWTNVGSAVEGQLSQIAGMLNRGNRAQFEAYKAIAMGQAAIATALTVVKMLGATAELGPAAIPLAFAAGAIGVAQMGLIANQKYEGREFGGDVQAGQTYIVGEKRPELFTPGRSGTITPYVPKAANGDVSITNNYDFRNATPESEQRMRAYVDQSNERVKAQILDNMNRGGRFAVGSGRMK